MTLAMSNTHDDLRVKNIIWDKEVASLGIYFDHEGNKSFVVKLGNEIIKTIENACELTEARKLALDFMDDDTSERGELSDVLLRCNQKVPVDIFYKQISDLKIVFGSNFRNLKHIWRNESEAVGIVELSQEIEQQAEKYLMHPVFLDSCFQIFGATLFSQDSRKTYLPTGIEELKILAAANVKLSKVWSYVRLRKEIELHDTSAYADLYFYDENSNLLGYAKGFSLKLAASSELLLSNEVENEETDYYQIKWVADSNTEENPEFKKEQYNWLVVSDEIDECTEYSSAVEELAGEVSSLKMKDMDFSKVKSEINQIFSTAYNKHKPINAVMFKTASNDITENIEQLELKQQIYSSYCLAIAQTLAATDSNNDSLFWLLTENAQQTNNDLHIDPSQSILWGLGRTINREIPSISCKNIDLEKGSAVIFKEIYQAELSRLEEEQSAWRKQKRYTAKLDYQNFKDKLDRDKPFQLKISEYGAIEHLILKPFERPDISANEVEIKVYASPINFKDILHALGMLQVDGQQSGVDEQQDMLFGGDCSGVVERVGKDVTDLKVGDKVVATMAFGCMASHVTVDNNLVVPMPESVSYADATSLTTSYITAHYALNELAKVKAGDKVLIHAGTGGLGMAAIHLAKLKGAIIYATAHPSKWHALEELGVDKIMNSRTLEFANDLSSAPYSGVDVVLNSLSGDFITESFNLLKENGRFIEVGKIGILTQQQASSMRPDVDYHAFDLMDLVNDKPGYFKQLFLDVIDLYKTGGIPTLQSKIFDIEDVHKAFDWMAHAKHIGKVVLSMLPQNNQAEIISSDGAYVISGGLGMLGKLLTAWLIEQGAKHLYLLSRSDKAITDYPSLNALKSADNNISLVKCDVTSYQSVAHLFSQIKQKGINVNGIFHAAGVLDDGIISEQSWSRFAPVYKAKITGAVNLHKASLQHSLDHFVSFSSIASAFGSEGQSNYAAANAFLDSFTEYRKSKGLAAVSINWGPWNGGGMASELEQANQQRIEQLGVTLITEELGMQHLEAILRNNKASANSIVLPINWQTYFSEAQTYSDSFYSVIKDYAAENIQLDYKASIEGLEQEQAQELIIIDVTRILIKVLRLDSDDRLEPTLRLNELGMDSLMGVELKNRVDKQFSIKLPISMLIESPSIKQLTSKIIELILPDSQVILNKIQYKTEQPKWIVNYSGKEQAVKRLICFHHLGGSAEIFRSWRGYLPENIDLCAIQLPGRGDRNQEKAMTEIAEIMPHLTPELEKYLDIPYAIFGHSMGTIIAYETISAISKLDKQLPEQLYVSGLWPPFLHDKQRERDLPSAERLDELEIPKQLLEDEEFKSELKNIIVADEKLLRNYRWQEQQQLEIPICAFSGKNDSIAKGDQVKKWQECTTKRFEYHELTGSHMFITEHEENIISKIVSGLTEYRK